jgi:hypothetical protein
MPMMSATARKQRRACAGHRANVDPVVTEVLLSLEARALKGCHEDKRVHPARIVRRQLGHLTKTDLITRDLRAVVEVDLGEHHARRWLGEVQHEGGRAHASPYA